MNALLIILGLLLLLFIFWQAPRQESLATAFSTTHKTKAERWLTKITFGLFIVICVALLVIKYL